MDKCWIHLRRSMNRQEKSLEQQQEYLEGAAEENNCSIVRKFCSYAGNVSGLDLEKDQAFKDMVRAAREPGHGVKYLFIYDTSRFGRMPARRKIYWEESFRECGIEVRYVGENFRNDGSLGDELSQYISHSEAHQFSLRLSKSTIRGCLFHSQLGHSCGGSAPYGYARALIDKSGNIVKILERGSRKFDKEHRVIWVLGDPMTIEVVRWIFEHFSKGNGLRAIVDSLNRRHVPSPYGKAWAKSTVREILRNPAYKGERIYFKHAYHERGPNAKKHIRPEKEWVRTANAHPAIISQELFDRVQARFRVRKTGDGTHYTSRHMLTGSIYCGRCNHRYGGRPKSQRKEKIMVYECNGYHSKGSYFCPSFSIPEATLDNFALTEVFHRTASLTGSNAIRTRLETLMIHSSGQDIAGRIASLDHQIKEKKEERSRLGKAIRKLADSETIITELESVENELKQLEAQCLELQSNTQSTTMDIPAAVEEMTSYLSQAEALLSRGTMEEKKTVIRSFLARVDILPEAREARFKFYKIPQPIQRKIADPEGADEFIHRKRCGGWI